MALPKRWCKRNHDTDISGRDVRGYCKECRRDWDRRRDPKVRAEREKDRTGRGYTKGPRHPIEWERDRVKAWLEIAAADPMPDSTGAAGRWKQFDMRYQRLEADVPTPENA